MTDTTDQQSVTVAQEDRDLLASIIRVAGFDTEADELQRGGSEGNASQWGGELEAIARHRLASVSSASAEPRALDWRLIAKAAGEHGVRYRTNTAMAKFLAAIASPEPVPATNQAGEVNADTVFAAIVHGDEDHRDWLREALDACFAGKHVPPPRGKGTALATQPATSQEEEGLAKYRHLKRGTVYEVIGTAELQAEQLQGDHAALTIYRGEDGKLWARNTAEFQDGRFELIALAAAPTPPTLSEDLRELVGTGHFILDRLVDHEVRMTSDDDAREWYGHVTPAMERFRAALAQVKAS